MNHVKTYELFGLFGKKKGVSKNVKSFLAHEKDEKSKKDKQEETQKIARRKSIETDKRFRERIKSTIESISHPCIDGIKVEMGHGLRDTMVLVNLNPIYLNDVIESFRSQNGLSFKDIKPHNPILTMELSIRPDYDRGRYASFGSNKGKEWMGVYHYSDTDAFTLYMKDIIDHKGNVGEKSEMNHILPHRESQFRLFRNVGSSNTPIIQYESGQTDNVDLSQIKNTIIYRASEMGRWVCRDIHSKIENFKKLKEFEVISKFTDDEVKDHMSDLIDISNDYEIKRSDEYIIVEFDIPGLRKYDDGMRMTKLNSQVSKYLTEIQGRLEERELEIGVKFDTDKLVVVINKMESENEEPKPKPRMAFPGPRR